MKHGNSCYSMGCRCAVGRAARAEATRRYKAMADFTKRFDLERWRDYVVREARDSGVGVVDFLEGRGIDNRTMSPDAPPVLWWKLDRLCCAVGVPTVALYPEFNQFPEKAAS